MTINLLHGDCREQLTTLPDKSVQCVVTSPPYYGLRKYSDDPREIGQEPTPALYVAAMVEVFRQVKRVLRDDGTVWLNLGDSYASSGGAGGAMAATGLGSPDRAAMPRPEATDPAAHGRWLRDWGVPDKNLLGIPWRVAFALQDDGWYLRSDIIWHKPNCMPESVTDRPTRAHEYLFLLAKSARYFYDAAAIAEPAQGDSGNARSFRGGGVYTNNQSFNNHAHAERETHGNVPNESGTRNKRTVWTIATQPYSGAHYATMPEALIEPCILAGSSAQACEHCGAAWGRRVERDNPRASDDYRARETTPKDASSGGIAGRGTPTSGLAKPGWRKDGMATNTTLGFAPRCACADNTGSARSVVLDPFAGSGTVSRVATRYQRDAVLCELNQAYIDEHIEQRTDKVQIELFV